MIGLYLFIENFPGLNSKFKLLVPWLNHSITEVYHRDTAVFYPTMTYFVAGPHRLTKMSSKQFSNYQLHPHNYYMYDFTLAAKPRIDIAESLKQEPRYYWPCLPPDNEVAER